MSIDININADLQNTEIETSSTTSLTESNSHCVTPINSESIVEGIKKEYSIVGDGLYASINTDEAPVWLTTIIDNLVTTSIAGGQLNYNFLVQDVRNAIDSIDILKNGYLNEIQITALTDGIVVSKLETLNATLGDIYATSVELDTATATTESAYTSLITDRVAFFNDSTNARITNVELAYADVDSALASSIEALSSRITSQDGDLTATSDAVSGLKTYVGLSAGNTPNNTGLLARVQIVENQNDGVVEYVSGTYDVMIGVGDPNTDTSNDELDTTVEPYASWIAIDGPNSNEEIRQDHIGDVFIQYAASTGDYIRAYKFIKTAKDTTSPFATDTEGYTWSLIADTDAANALIIALRAKDLADGKRRVFVGLGDTSTPTTPYDVGDLWLIDATRTINGQTAAVGDIFRAIETKGSASTYEQNDWVIASSFVAAVNAEAEALEIWKNEVYGVFVSDIETQVDQKAESFYQESPPRAEGTDTSLAVFVGDLWKVPSNNQEYVYQLVNGTYQWVETDVPDSVYDTIDGKKAIYVGNTPPIGTTISPIQINDMWITGDSPTGGFDTETIYVAVSLDPIVWVIPVKYTDDSGLVTLSSGLTNGTVTIDLSSATVDGSSSIIEYVSSQLDLEVVIYSGTDVSTQTGMKIDDIYIEKAVNNDGAVAIDVVNTYKYNGTDWVEIGSNSNLTALADLADGKRTIFSNVSNDVPTGVTNDIWIPKTGSDDATYIPGEVYQSNGTTWILATKYTEDLTAFIEVSNEDSAQLHRQLDGKIEYSFYKTFNDSTGPVDLTGAISEAAALTIIDNFWNTEELRDNANGNIVYFKDSKNAYWYQGSNDVWLIITDTSIYQALEDAAQAKGAADGKVSQFYAWQGVNAPADISYVSNPDDPVESQITEVITGTTFLYWFKNDNNLYYKPNNSWIFVPVVSGSGNTYIAEGDVLSAFNSLTRDHSYHTYNGTSWQQTGPDGIVSKSQFFVDLSNDVRSDTGLVGSALTQLSIDNNAYTDGEIVTAESNFEYDSSLIINGVHYNSGFGLNSTGAGSLTQPSGADGLSPATAFDSEFYVNAERFVLKSPKFPNVSAVFTVGSSGITLGTEYTDATRNEAKGDYSSVTNYIKGDIVTYLGSSYTALRETINDTPDVSELDWQLFASKGDNGIEGSSAIYSNLFDTVADQSALTAYSGTTATVTSDKFSGAFAIAVTSTVASTNSAGNGETVYLTIPEELALRFAGETVTVSLYAKAIPGNESASFSLAYSTAEVGNSGFTSFVPTASFAKYEIEYLVPLPNVGGVDYIIISPDDAGSGKGIIIDNVQCAIKSLDGKSVTVTNNGNNTYTITGANGSIIVSDGNDGDDAPIPTLTNNGDGTYTIDNSNGQSLTFADGDTPQLGIDYFVTGGNYVSNIFINSTTRPTTPTTGYFDGTAETFPSGWSDNPTDYTPPSKRWFSTRQYERNAETGVWTASGAWSTPALQAESGADGQNVTVVDNGDGSYTITDANGSVTVYDGIDAPIPTIADNDNGTFTITDGSGNSVIVSDGYTPLKGIDYFDAKDGAFVSSVYITSVSQPSNNPTGGSFDGSTEVLPTNVAVQDTPYYTEGQVTYVSITRYKQTGTPGNYSWSNEGWSTFSDFVVKGDTGTGSTVVDNGDGSYTITGANGSITVSDGLASPIPTVADNGDGTFTVSDGDGNSVIVSDGDTPIKGIDYFDAKDGAFVSKVYLAGTVKPDTPTGGSFDGTTEVLPTNVPVQDTPYYITGNVTWISVTRYVQSSIEGDYTWANTGWSAFSEYIIQGDDGEDGQQPVVSKEYWGFNNTEDNFTKRNATHSTGATSLTLVSTSADFSLITPDFNLNGNENYLIAISLRCTSHSVSSVPVVFYETISPVVHGHQGGFRKQLSDTQFNQNEWITLLFDMRELTAGGTDWVDSVISSVRFDPMEGTGYTWEFDYFQIGHYGSPQDGVSVTGPRGTAVLSFSIPATTATPESLSSAVIAGHWNSAASANYAVEITGDTLVLTNPSTTAGWTHIYEYNSPNWTSSTAFTINGNAVVTGTLAGDAFIANTIITSPIIESANLRGALIQTIGPTHMIIQRAAPFGPNSLIEWYGVVANNVDANGDAILANLTKVNGIAWKDGVGNVYTSGTIIAGTLTVSKQTSEITNSPSISTGVFGSNGGQILLNCSAFVNFSQISTGNVCSTASADPQIVIRLYNTADTLVFSDTFTGSTDCSYEFENDKSYRTYFVNGSFSFYDNDLNSANRNYRVEATVTNVPLNPISGRKQRLSILSQEVGGDVASGGGGGGGTSIPANDASITVNASSGLSGSGVFTVDQSADQTISLIHAAPAATQRTKGGGGTSLVVVNRIETDVRGHVQSTTNDVNLLDHFYTESESDGRFLGINANASDSDKLGGVSENEGNISSTIVKRNVNGDIRTRLFRSEYTNENGSANYLMTQNALGTGDNYLRPISTANFIANHVRNTTVDNADNLGNFSASSYLRTNGNEALTGNYSTIGGIEAGRGSGGISLTVNDGHGNANVAFNHKNGVPDVSGSSARIEVNVDNAAAEMYFELGSNSVAATAKGLTPSLTLRATNAHTLVGSLTATTFIGALSGNATTASNSTNLNGLPSSSYLTTSSAGTTYLARAGGTMSGLLTLSDAGYSLSDACHKWVRSYVVNTAAPQELLYSDGNALPDGGVYRFTAHIAGTGTDQFANAVYWNQNGTWRINVTGQSGTSSNNPEFIISATTNKPTIHIDHASNYTVTILAERIELGEGIGTDNAGYAFGTDAFLGSTGNSLYFNPNGTTTTGQGVYAAGNVVYHAGNDGSGSGLDADKLDGVEGSSFLRSDTNDSFSGLITGNFLHLGGSQLVDSSAKLQVNGFMRTGNIFLHEGGNSPTSADGILSNVSGTLNWKDKEVYTRASTSMQIDGRITSYFGGTDSISMRKVADTDYAGMSWKDASSTTRWLLYIDNNAQGDLHLQGRRANGAYQHTTLKIDNNTGIVQFGIVPNILNEGALALDSKFADYTTTEDGVTGMSAVPDDYWNGSNNSLNITNIGLLGTEGAYRTSWTWNGYRNKSGGFTYRGVNGNTTTASILEHDSEGLRYRAGSASGSSLPQVFSVGSSGNLDVTGHIYTDNGKALVMGNSSDFRIRFDGANALLDNFTGNIYTRNFVSGGHIYHEATTTSGSIQRVMGIYGGASTFAELSYDNSVKLSTETHGITVNGSSRGTSEVVAGHGSGSVSININDGGGNANVAFNHAYLKPDVSGNSGRITVNADVTTGAHMQFQLLSGTIAGNAVPLSVVFQLEENKASFNHRNGLLEIYSTVNDINAESTLRLNGQSQQGVDIRLNTYDSNRPPFGVHIERAKSNGQTTSKAYLEVEGDVIAGEYMYAKSHGSGIANSKVLTYDDFLPDTPPVGLENTISANWISAGAIQAKHLQINGGSSVNGSKRSFKINPDSERPLSFALLNDDLSVQKDIFYVDSDGNAYLNGKLSKDTVDIESIQEDARKQINPYYSGTSPNSTKEITTSGTGGSIETPLPAVTIFGGNCNVSWKLDVSEQYFDQSSSQNWTKPVWRVRVYRNSVSGTPIVNKVYTGSVYNYYDQDAFGYNGSAQLKIEDFFYDENAPANEVYVLYVTRESGTATSITRRLFRAHSASFNPIKMKLDYTTLYYNAAGLDGGTINLSEDLRNFEFLSVTASANDHNITHTNLIAVADLVRDYDQSDNNQFMLFGMAGAVYWQVSPNFNWTSLADMGEAATIFRVSGVNITEK
jgi:hypothetical protein